LRELFCFAFGPPAWLIVRLAAVVGYPSGQRGQTVNLLTYVFDGSNPSPTTTLKTKDKTHFYTMFSMCFSMSLFLSSCASVLLATFAVPSKTMRIKQPNLKNTQKQTSYLPGLVAL
jgi:hypothetical protein